MKRQSTKFPFTLAKLKALKPEDARYYVLDTKTPGLAVMVTPQGKKSYYFVRKVRGRVERIRIGGIEITSKTLKTAIGKLQGQIADGRSPTHERHALRAEMTLGELWELYKTRHGEAKRSWSSDQGRYKLDLKAWAKRKLSSISRADVATLLAKITTTSGPIAANRTRALLHTMFAKGITWGLEIANPAAGTARNAEHSKARYLQPAELRRLWRALDDADETHAFVRLLLLTGVRSGTLAAARWADIDLKDRIWHIPAANMKAGRSLDLPLAARAAEVFAARRKLVSPAPFVFPNAGTASGHLATIPRDGWTALLTTAEITGLTPHDLRRSHATYGLAAGIPIEVLGKALGHTPIGGVTSIYAQADVQLVRLAVERTVDALLKIAEAPEGTEASKVLAFPKPAWAQEGTQ